MSTSGRTTDLDGRPGTAAGLGAHEPIDGARAETAGLLNVVQAARDWEVPRVGVASTIGVYSGAGSQRPLRENLPLSMLAGPEHLSRHQPDSPGHGCQPATTPGARSLTSSAGCVGQRAPARRAQPANPVIRRGNHARRSRGQRDILPGCGIYRLSGRLADLPNYHANRQEGER
jgi:hypothetical protein